ncbi:transglycosylase SLT domain-containing protein [Aliivibrio fischeri]|uniref:transglycosylase SLT domain-containing protein n=1 Tax=Aliivibrio fischeri TaxID=668 RepID=UPI0012D9A0EC|nr:transglycosylase SLT domain-containing protein [Aliivibrio fischeri]MUI55269.1 transglycosylase SLT domain-containing protein [Aliivibrio fischeri]
MKLFHKLFFTLLILPINAEALELAPLSNKSYKGDYNEISKKGVIRVLVSMEVGFYQVSNGKPIGIISEFLSHFERHLAKKNDHTHIRIIPVSDDDLIWSLKAGFGDIAVGHLAITKARLRHIDFSTPTIKDSEEWLITAKGHAPITELADLSGKEIWVKGSSSYFETLQNINDQLTSNNMAPMDVHFLEESLGDNEVLEMVENKLLPATVIENYRAILWKKIIPNIQYHEEFPLKQDINIAWAVRKNSPQLTNVVNQYITKIKKGSFLGNLIYKKYLNDEKWLAKILQTDNIDKLYELSDLFKHYSSMYNLDWQLTSALAYQESRLDNKAVSHKGAVGIMQVLPSTAKDKHVQIDNIYTLENNIHAGIKYLSFVHKRYFDKPEISADDQLYFSLAAYNAGPAKIRRIRKKAQEQGYDPNVWFNNVELMALKYISKEPVHYVSNISRYYVIYKQIVQLKEQKEQRNALNKATFDFDNI